MIILDRVSKSYGTLNILSDISFTLGKGQKAALVGSNGVGKTTLLKIIAGLEKTDSGRVKLSPNICLGYLPQEIMIDEDETVADYLREVVGIQSIEKRMQSLESQLADPEKLAEYSDLQQVYERLGGSTLDHRVKTVLAGF
jgi:ATPase subunit of ABC transporter with duplicated ATPase domains